MLTKLRHPPRLLTVSFRPSMPASSTVSRHWRPRTLLQLVLLGFVLVTAPLLYLIYETTHSLDTVASRMQQYSQEALSTTQRGQQLVSLSIELERTARQFQVVRADSLHTLFSQQLDRFRNLLELQHQQADIGGLYQELEQLLVPLPDLVSGQDTANELDTVLTQIDSKTEQLRDSVDKLVNQRLDELNHFNEDTRTHLLLSSTLLLALSLVLMIMSGLVITRPVRRLEKMITLLGEGKALPSNRIGGPAELANLGGKLHWLDQQLASLEQQKKQFLRHMSHELKTPLASLREGADLLGEGVLGELNTSQQEVVELMQYNSQQLQRLIEQLLDYNMLHQNLPMAMSACELPTLIKEVVTLHQLSVQQKQIHLQTQGDALNWPADRHKLQRCLDNLISNAINYGAREGQILVAWQTINNRLIIDVANTGQAIAAAERARIFEPFYQGQSQRLGPLKGSGIGLSVARDCIEAHGGSLTLHDLHGFDVCFRIELPESEHLAV